jgi:uncharacterized protein
MNRTERVPQYLFRERWPRPIWFLYRVIRTVMVVSAFIGFWGGGFILAWTVVPLIALFARDPLATCQRMVRAGFRLFHGYMRMLGLLDAQVIGDSRPADRGPVVYVANHATLVDVTAMLASFPKVCATAGAGFLESPFVGRLITLCGFIPDGKTMKSAAQLMEVAEKRLGEGYDVLLFPEGSRSPQGELRRFHRGAFELACRAKVPVVPIVIRCNPSALRKDQRVWQQPDTVALMTLELEPALDPADFQFVSRKMRDAVEAGYRERLGLPVVPPKSGLREQALHGVESEGGVSPRGEDDARVT